GAPQRAMCRFSGCARGDGEIAGACSTPCVARKYRRRSAFDRLPWPGRRLVGEELRSHETHPQLLLECPCAWTGNPFHLASAPCFLTRDFSPQFTSLQRFAPRF